MEFKYHKLCPHLVMPICCSPFLSLLKVISAVLPIAQDAVPGAGCSPIFPLNFPSLQVLPSCSNQSPSSMESFLLSSCLIMQDKSSARAGRLVQAVIQKSSEWACAPLTYKGFRHLPDMPQSFKCFAHPGAKCAQVEVYIRKTVDSEFRHMFC